LAFGITVCKKQNLLILFLLISTIFLSGFPPFVEPAKADSNWLPGWSYRRSHLINPADGAGRDYQINIQLSYNSQQNQPQMDDSYGVVDLGGHSRTDFGDVRFTEADGSTLLDYWLEGYQEVETQTTMSGSFYVANDGTVYATAGNTLYKSNDGGQNWESLVTVLASELTGVFVASNNYVYFTAYNDSVNSGLWRGTGNSHWTQVLELPPNCSVLGSGGMDDASNGDLFYGVYTFGSSAANAQIYRSTDNGATWNSVFYDPTARHIHNVQVDRSNDCVYATAGDVSVYPWNVSYILRSTDNGDTWSQILSDIPQCVAIDVTPTTRLFGSDYLSGRIYRTTDDSSYSMVLDVGQSAICYWIRTDSLTQRTYASFVSDENNPTFARIYVSEDDGKTWETYLTLTAIQPYDGSLEASNFMNGAMYYTVRQDGVNQNNVELYPGLASFWVKIADDISSSSTTIYLYYGNSDATTTSSIADTFLFGDDTFEYGWENIYGTVADWEVSNEQLHIEGADVDDAFVGKAFNYDLTNNIRLIYKWRPDNIAGGYWSNHSPVMLETDISPSGDGALTHTVRTDYAEHYVSNDQGNYGVLSNDNVAVGVWYSGMLTYDSSTKTAELEIDDSYQGSLVFDASPTTSVTYIGFGTYLDDFTVDYVAAAKYVYPEPAQSTWGNEEHFTQDAYALTITTAGSGSVLKSPDQASYQYGDVVELTAVPAEGWTFVGWSGDMTGSNNAESITIDSDKIIVANFASPPPKTRFDFGISGSPVEAGYTQVSDVTSYSASQGYGWSSTANLRSRDRSAPDELRRDFIFGNTEGNFKVDLSNSEYLVTVVIGDLSFRHDKIDIYAEGVHVIDDITTPAGSFQEVSFRVAVVDEQLNLRVVDDGGTDPNWVLDALTIDVAPSLLTEASFDFGTVESPVQAGYTQVIGSTAYSARTGYGWTSTAGLTPRDRENPDDLRRDFVFSSAERTFDVDLMNGGYTVTVVIGDQSFLHDKIDIYAEGVLEINDVTTCRGSFQEISFEIIITDGQLNLTMLNDGGVDPNWVLNTLRIQSY
jgi:uncharacterized repeat protein (TIGR02543 family)